MKNRWFELPCGNIEELLGKEIKNINLIGKITVEEYSIKNHYQLFHLSVEEKQKILINPKYYDYCKFIPIAKILQHKISPHTSVLFHEFEVVQLQNRIYFMRRSTPRERYSRCFLEGLI